jgi:hypothetical protein
MFVESKDTGSKSGFESRLDAFGRRHPGLFTAALVVLAAAVTVGLLFKPTYTVVLYQGF